MVRSLLLLEGPRRSSSLELGQWTGCDLGTWSTDTCGTGGLRPHYPRKYPPAAKIECPIIHAVDAETRGWLIEHNGEPLPPHVIAHIMAVTGGTTDSEWWAGESADGPQLSDEAVDWIEAVANDEEPTAG